MASPWASFAFALPTFMAKKQLDMLVRNTILSRSRMFTKSWGSPKVLKTLRHYQNKYALQGAVMELIERDIPKMVIEKDELHKDYQIQEGWFQSPLDKLSPIFFDSAGQNAGKAYWKGYFPRPGWPRKGLVILLAPTGDHTYLAREIGFAKPLLAEGISSILLQNPFYADRKPKAQFRSALQNVSDLYVMGGSLICECCFLLRWAKEQGHSPLGLSGISMGGYMASLAASNVRDHPVALTSLLSWTSAAPVFTQGILSNAISWDTLTKELEQNPGLKQQLLEDSRWAEIMDDPAHPVYQLFPDSPAKRLMWILMEEFTNLGNYPVPYDPTKVHFVLAEDDLYVPMPKGNPQLIPDIRQLWPGSNVTEVPNNGHLSAYLTEHGLFRNKILETLGINPPSSPTSAVLADLTLNQTQTEVIAASSRSQQ